MIKKFKLYLFVLSIFIVSACKLDLLDNPNAVTTANTDVNYLASQIQITYAGHFNQMSDPAMRLTRMLNQGAALYDNAVTPGGLDGTWTTAYAGILNDIKTLIPIAEKGELFVHAGMARVLRASVLLNLVDAFGDVPYTEALDPYNFVPKADGAASVYTAAIADIDKAIENFNAKSKSGLTVDLYYGGTVDNWIRAANTLKLKALLNRRLVDQAGSKTGIDALITGGKLISATAQNFTFKYGTNLTNPDNRHPRYGGQYTATGGGDYQSNAYMGGMFDKQDPRIRAYFYRQTITNSTDVNEIRCINNAKPSHYSATDYYCFPTANAGYWGRDHLSNEGIPPDGLRRTAWGLYPAGGAYDNDNGKPVALGFGAGGAGIQPILMSSFTDFMLAESALTLGTAGDAKALLESAIRKSMADVRAFMLASTEAGKITTFETSKGIVWATQVDNYVKSVMDAYTAASTTDKLNIIATEYWYSLYGNGIEAYNLYRRTGMPKNMQPALDPNAGAFVRSYYYPTAYVSRNTNAKQKANMAVAVFWDTNPAGILK